MKVSAAGPREPAQTLVVANRHKRTVNRTRNDRAVNVRFEGWTHHPAAGSSQEATHALANGRFLLLEAGAKNVVKRLENG